MFGFRVIGFLPFLWFQSFCLTFSWSRAHKETVSHCVLFFTVKDEACVPLKVWPCAVIRVYLQTAAEIIKLWITQTCLFLFSVSNKSEESNMWLGDQNQPTTESGPVGGENSKNWWNARRVFSHSRSHRLNEANWFFSINTNLLGFTGSVRGDGTSEIPGYVSSRIVFVLNSSDTNFERESRKTIFQSLFYR